MVLTLMIPLRKIFRYEPFITIDVLENVAKTIIFTGLIVGYAYIIEYFIAWYTNNTVEQESFRWRCLGYYSWEFWVMVIFNALVPLLFFFKKIRRSIPWLFAISIAINIGMWFERFVIIVGGPAHEYIPYSWANHTVPAGPKLVFSSVAFPFFFFFFFFS